MIATIWELWEDRAGDINKSADLLPRIALLWFEALLLHLLTTKNIFLAFNLSLAFYFLVFDYAIAYILIKNGTLEPPRGVKYHWFTYKAKSGVIDNIKWWRNMNPWIKLHIRVAYFWVSLFLFLNF